MNTVTVKFKTRRFGLVMFLVGIATIVLAFVINPIIYSSLRDKYYSQHDIMYFWDWEKKVYGNNPDFYTWQIQTYGDSAQPGSEESKVRNNAWMQTSEYQESQERLASWENSNEYQALQEYENYDQSVNDITSFIASALAIIGAILILVALVISVRRLIRKRQDIKRNYSATSPFIGKTNMASKPELQYPKIDKKNESLLLSVENVLLLKPMEVTIGDIFITTKGFYFLPYSTDPSYGTLGAVLAGVLGGIAGGIAASRGEKQTAERALSSAEETRNNDYGISIYERFQRNKNYHLFDKYRIFIEREKIVELVHNKESNLLVCRTAEDISLEYQVPSSLLLDDNFIHAYMQGENPQYDVEVPKRYGLNLPYPDPAHLLTSLDQGTEVDSYQLDEAAKDGIFISSFYPKLENISRSQRINICTKIARLSPSFASRLAAIARDHLREIYLLNGILAFAGIFTVGITLVFSLLFSYKPFIRHREIKRALGF